MTETFRPFVIGPTQLRIHCLLSPNKSESCGYRESDITLDFGGAGHNLAQAFVGVGADPTLWTVLPDSAAGGVIRNHLHNSGITCHTERTEKLPAAVEHWGNGQQPVYATGSDPMEHHVLDPDRIAEELSTGRYSAIVMAGGLPAEGIGRILSLAAEHKLPVAAFATNGHHMERFLGWATEINLVAMTGLAWQKLIVTASTTPRELARRFETTIAVITEDLRVMAANRFEDISKQAETLTGHPSMLAATLIQELLGGEGDLFVAVETAAKAKPQERSEKKSDSDGAFSEAVGEMVKHANHDPLTDLLNRRGMERSMGTGHYAVIVSDIDHFKSVNDEFGHKEGDRVLRDVALVMRQELRSMDLAVRWGGEEFVALLPRADLGAGVAIAERIREKLQAKVSVGKRQITGSFGVTTTDLRSEPVEIAVARADKGLYQAKQSGRNRVIAVPEKEAALA